MANEWTKADVLRVMREERAMDNSVSVARVRERFALSRGASSKRFEEMVGRLEADGLLRVESSHVVWLLE